VRQHERTTRNSPRRVRCWLILAAALLAPGSLLAQVRRDQPGTAESTVSQEPVDLAAGSIRTWTVGSDHWVYLSGQAAVIQGLEGVRADQVVIRVSQIGTAKKPLLQLEVYAEGNAAPISRPRSSQPSYRMTLNSTRDPRLKPYQVGGIKREGSRPKALAILDRAFPPAGSQKSLVAAGGAPLSLKNNGPATHSQHQPANPSGGALTDQSTGLPIPEIPEKPIPSQSRPSEPSAQVAPRRSLIETAQSTALPAPVPIASADLPPLDSPPRSATETEPSPAAEASKKPTDLPPPDAIPLPVPVAAVKETKVIEEGGLPPPVVDQKVAKSQFAPEGLDEDPPPVDLPEPTETPEMDDAPVVPNLSPIPLAPPSTLRPPTEAETLPGPGPSFGPGQSGGADSLPNAEAIPDQPALDVPEEEQKGSVIPVMPDSQRKTRIYSRDGGPYSMMTLADADGYRTLVVRGGVNLVTESPAPMGVLELSADRIIVWRKIDTKVTRGPNGEELDDPGDPLEVYLEGNVQIRQDQRMIAGNADQLGYFAERAFYDVRAGRLVAINAELNMFAPGLVAPTKMFSPRIDQFRPLTQMENGKYFYGLEQIQADQTLITGSRFPTPGYRFSSRSIDVHRVISSHADPTTGELSGDPRDPRTEKNLTWRIDARRNLFYLGPVPVFFWPRIVGNADDIEPPIRQLRYGYNNYLGHQILSDFNGFRLFGLDKPEWIDNWNVDIDYLSMRTKVFPALGTEIGWFGKDFLSDLSDPYRKKRRVGPQPGPDGYYGYLDMWGLIDDGIDVLGSGPAIVTPNGDVRLPDGTVPGKRGYQRGISGIPGLPNGVPPFQRFRGRVNLRHMQSLLGPDVDPYEDLRFQLEAAYVSDRQFLEEYYKRLTETGLDQETLFYLIRQKNNTAWSIWTEANLQNFNTETQWLPRLDYYRFGDSPFANLFTYSQHSGINYANTHTANEVNNPNIFAFIPYDPISNTSGVFSSGRVFSNHELDLPLNFDNILRVVPYVQGQVAGWDNQINGNAVGRVWGAAGARADIMAWKRYPDIESDMLNIHGLNHKVSFQADYRNAYSNVKLNELGIQDDLDDNTYEFVRRYFALTQYHGGLLPNQYDPRHLLLRRGLSPISGPSDVQASIQTLQLNLHSRLQTKRGPEGRRRIMDLMTLDLSTTFFPYAERDNFGKAFGQNMYNWQWFIGDRTSLVSYGWFEFFDITGRPTNKVNTLYNDPFGLNVITSGISISRPPRGNIFIGYTILDSGQVTTSALNPSVSYWMSPKWYGTFSTSYDFGNAIWLSSMFSFTRVGADYLTTIGLVVDPQRNNYSQIAVAISPRVSPGIRLGSGSGLSQFDSRFAPTQ